MPGNGDVPLIDIVPMEEREPQEDAIGVKGTGYGGTTGVAAAGAKRLHDASGVRGRDLPIPLDRLARPAARTRPWRRRAPGATPDGTGQDSLTRPPP